MVAVRDQLLDTDEPLKGLLDEFLAFLEVVEDLALESEEAAVDPEVSPADTADVLDEVVVAERDRMKALTRTYADEAADLVLPVEVVEVFRQREIGEPIAVVREEDGIVPEIVPDGVETLADVGVETCVGECDLPVLDVAAAEPDIEAAAGQLEVVRHALVVVEEVSLDEIATITETENELSVTEVRIVLHEMPDDRPVADVR